MEMQCTRRLEEIMKHFKLKDPGSAITHFIGMLDGNVCRNTAEFLRANARSGYRSAFL